MDLVDLATALYGAPVSAPPRPAWLDVLSGLGLVSATVAVVVGVATLWQKNHADRREAWWKRAQWAMELAVGEDPDRQVLGLEVLRYLTVTKMAKKDEKLVLDSVGWLFYAEERDELGDDGDDVDVALDPGGHHG